MGAQDIKELVEIVSMIVGVGGFGMSVWSAKGKWDQQREESRVAQEASRTAQMEGRQQEVRRLRRAFKRVASTFAEVFDYSSATTNRHLRVAPPESLRFTAEEMATRTKVDEAFEHLREVHRSLALQLVAADDLSFWTYWIHRIELLPSLAAYAKACGYDAFLGPLRSATAGDPQLLELQANCPWWPKERGPLPDKVGESSGVREGVEPAAATKSVG